MSWIGEKKGLYTIPEGTQAVLKKSKCLPSNLLCSHLSILYVTILPKALLLPRRLQ